VSISNKKVLCTLAVGTKYEKMFARYCKKNWSEYCSNYSYDMVVITNLFDDSIRGRERSPSWQKLLILSQDWSSQYEQVVWVDADVMINAKIAPDITKILPVHKVGAVETYSIPSEAIHKIALQRQYDAWHAQGVNFIDNATPSLYYEKRGIPGGALDKVAQAGVLVCSPKDHKEIFEHVYYRYEDENKSAYWNYEMPAISYELVKNDLIEWIPSEFNFCVSDLISAFYPFIFDSSSPKSLVGKALAKISRNLKIGSKDPKTLLRCQCLKNIYDLGYFIHFAGCSSMMEELYQSFQDTE
jgi:hypothetical protein